MRENNVRIKKEKTQKLRTNGRKFNKINFSTKV